MGTTCRERIFASMENTAQQFARRDRPTLAHAVRETGFKMTGLISSG
jgi:hypothetical protein